MGLSSYWQIVSTKKKKKREREGKRGEKAVVCERGKRKGEGKREGGKREGGVVQGHSVTAPVGWGPACRVSKLMYIAGLDFTRTIGFLVLFWSKPHGEQHTPLFVGQPHSPWSHQLYLI